MYRVFDLWLESELDLRGLLPGGEGEPDWSVTVADGAGEARGFRHVHTWTSDRGVELMACFRCGDAYRLEFPGLASYVIDLAARRVEIQPRAGCAENTLAHLLLDQVLPRAVCHEGRVVLHASAVQLEAGKAVAFTGVSGRGKSTLASAFHRAGYGLLSDDCLLLERRENTVHAIPAYPSLRLWPDSADALFARREAESLQAAEMAHYTSKQVFSPLVAASLAVRSPLRALFLLGPPVDDGSIGVEETRGMSAIMALIEAQFALDVVDRQAVQRNFECVQQVAGHVPLFRLSYPRDYGILSQVCAKIIDFL